MNIIHEIELKYASMGKKEKLLAEYVLKNATDLKNISIHDLANILSIAPSTITRFCRRLGCNSFVEFKMQLHNLSQITIPQENNFHGLVSGYYNEVINRTADLVSEGTIEKVVKSVLAANRIIIYGLGSSGLTAEELRMRLIRMGLNVLGERDAHMIIMGSKLSTANDLVIGISNSGDTPEIIEALENAKRNGAQTIFMTSKATNDIDDSFANIHIYLYNKQFLNKTFFVNTQITALYVIDLITLKLLENTTLKENIKSTYHRIISETQIQH